MSNNQQPLPPADLSKLRNILGGAKAIMNKTESGTYEKGNVTMDTSVSGHDLVEGAGQQMPQQQIPQQQMGQQQYTSNPLNNPAPQIVNGQAQYRNMETSKMPAFIKEAMMNNPIPQMSGPNHTFNLEDVSDLIEKPLPTTMSNPKTPAPIRESRQVQQNANDTFTVSETALRGIIKDVVKEELLEFMSETFAKKLTEQAIKRTINTLIKEGKLKTKKPVNG